MRHNSGKTISIWMTTAAVLIQPVFTENTHVDVCVVGAGIAWMSSALSKHTDKIISGHAG
ncbi:hypothetical protein [Nostoc punctiforme]|uniref:Uncharacterized protein n=1 Tax=Nostoc punctiforme (strain ATCC 29133 / PCC 73102) TaxID=63737 RepID=B2IWJ6_NOSP7|nr:hypothetical protein [Nostoc punctiforme]ACC81450.1 hypothetical protein Npun_R2918 [Nostoc punctiforme PCC 73102]